MPRKRQRIQAIEEQYTDNKITTAQNELLLSKNDEDLFILDNIGSKSARVKVQKLKTDEIKLTKSENKNLIKAIEKKNKITQNLQIDTPKAYDLWETPSTTTITPTSTTTPTTPTTKKVRTVPVRNLPLSSIIPGMSYNPSVTDHQEALAEALSLERKKLLKEEQDKVKYAIYTRTSQSPSLQLTNNNSTNIHDAFEDLLPLTTNDDDSSDDDDDSQDNKNNNNDNDIDELNSIHINKKQVNTNIKLTKTQRNRMKRQLNKTNTELIEKQKNKLLKTIDNQLPTIIKQLNDEEKLSKHIQNFKIIKKSVTDDCITAPMTYDIAGDVPLSDELTGSLRTLIPRGNRLRDHSKWKAEVGDVNEKSKRKRRAYERPHGAGRVKWIEAVK